MADKLFSIACETCTSRLAVRDAALIGQIVSCPKCASMVMVAPPAGWTPGVPAASGGDIAQPREVQAQAARPAAKAQPAMDSAAVDSTAVSERWSQAIDASPAPPVAASPSEVRLTGEDWLTPWQRWHRRWLPGIGAASAGVAAALVVWYLVAPGDEAEEADVLPSVAAATDDAPPVSPTVPPIAPKKKNIPAPRASEPAVNALPLPIPVATPVAESPVLPDAPPKPADPPVAQADVPPSAPGEAAVEAPVRPRRDPLVAVDVAARLRDGIAKLDYPKTRLDEFLDVVSAYSTVPITIDVDSLMVAGKRPDATIAVKLVNKTVEEAIAEAVKQAGVRYEVVDQHVLVVSDSDDANKTFRRDVTGLVSDNSGQVETLAAQIKRLVAPFSWQPQMKTSIRADKLELVFVQSPSVMRQVDAFLARLRAVRGNPASSAVAPGAVLATRYSAALPTLSRKVTLNYGVPTPLAKIVGRLRRDFGLAVVVDWRSLADEQIGPATTATVAASGATLEDALDSLVDSLGVAYRILDDRTIEITTTSTMAAKADLEAYPAADLVAVGVNLDALAKTYLGPATGASGAWHIDAASGTLFVLAPQDAQVQFEKALRDARAGAAKAEK